VPGIGEENKLKWTAQCDHAAWVIWTTSDGNLYS